MRMEISQNGEKGPLTGVGAPTVTPAGTPAPVLLTPREAGEIGGRKVIETWKTAPAAVVVLSLKREGGVLKVEEINAASSAEAAPSLFFHLEEERGLVIVTLPRFDAGEDTELLAQCLLRDVVDYVDDPVFLMKIFVSSCRELYNYEYSGYRIALSVEVAETATVGKGEVRMVRLNG